MNDATRPEGAVLRECAVEGKTIFELAPESRAARQYDNLTQFVLSWK